MIAVSVLVSWLIIAVFVGCAIAVWGILNIIADMLADRSSR